MDGVDNINVNGAIIILINYIYMFLIVFCFISLFAIVVFSAEVKMTTCRLAKHLIVKDHMACVYVGANNTEYLINVPKEVGFCVKEYQCPYRPNTKPFNLKSIIKSIKDQF